MKITTGTIFYALGASLAVAEMKVERLDSALDSLVAADAKIEVLASGYKWAEGPVWNKETNELLFSDVPNNVIHAWDGTEARVYMSPSGYTGVGDYGKEDGSNGLTFDAGGNLILAEHGDRRVSILKPGGGKMTLADTFQGKRFSSPNDVVVHSSGAVYFTDPIYGLPGGETSEFREIDFCGVFRISPDGDVTLITKELERPNGLAFSPDEKTLYVANSHGPRPVVLAVEIGEDGAGGKAEEFFNSGDLEGEGSMDGLKIDAAGNLWATGPGGLLVISPQGKLLGRILTGKATANVAFGGKSGKTVFLTAHDSLVSFERK